MRQIFRPALAIGIVAGQRDHVGGVARRAVASGRSRGIGVAEFQRHRIAAREVVDVVAGDFRLGDACNGCRGAEADELNAGSLRGTARARGGAARDGVVRDAGVADRAGEVEDRNAMVVGIGQHVAVDADGAIDVVFGAGGLRVECDVGGLHSMAGAGIVDLAVVEGEVVARSFPCMPLAAVF